VIIFDKLPDGREMWVDPDGGKGILDSYRGIGLLITHDRPLIWVVVSMFRRTDTGTASAPFIMQYGKN